MTDTISDALNLMPLSSNLPALVEPPTDESKDFEYARENLYNTIEIGQDALRDLAELAKSSQHPRGYEVMATMLKTLADINNQLLDLQTKQKELNSPLDRNSEKTINNNLVLTTADLSKLLTDMAKNKE